jgi:hypothetical protein
MIKALKNITLATSSIILIWLFISYIEIVCKNLCNPVYSNYNLIVMIFKNFDKLLIGGIF